MYPSSSSISSRNKDKQMRELSKSHSPNFLDDELDAYFPTSGTHLRGWSSRDHIGSAEISVDEVGKTDLVSAINQKMTEHADVLLHSVQCLSARVSQMESRTRRLENSLDDLKEVVESSYGNTLRKLTEIENVLMELQDGIKDIRDKQEIAEVQLSLSKLSTSITNLQVEKESTFQANSTKEASSSASMQSHQLLPVSVPHNYPPTSPQVPSQPFPTPAAAIFAATSPQLPSLPLSYHLPVASSAATNQHFNVQAAQLPQPTPQTHQKPFQPLLASCPQLTQLPPILPPFDMANTQAQYFLHHPPEVPHPPSHGIQKPTQPPLGSLPSVQFNFSSIQQVHDQPQSRPESQAQWWQPSGQANTDPYQYGGSLARDGNLTMKTLQPLTSHSTPRPVEDNPSVLQTARALPHAIPTASIVDTGSISSGTRTRVPVDDVVDRVVAMGFRRDMVRATVKKLTEQGQGVDLNVVLDKLMNNG